MKLITSLIFTIFFALLSFGQDTIVNLKNEFIRTKVLEITSETIRYKKFENLSGPNYTISSNEVKEIRFENWTVEFYKKDNPEPKRSLQETKDFIVRIINEYGWEKDSDTRRLKASFEGDLLRIVVMNKKYTKPVNSGLAYNFARVYKFKGVSKRPGDIAFIDIWIDFLFREKEMRYEKRKLVIEIHSHLQAEELAEAFRHLNKLLLAKEQPVEQF